ncbi:hypothetical protein MAR_034645 [Mya arenaria]|uniref:Protein kinase domain-containing protein n=1 Tax=Mya arenaria TaxID=6604 RepID=A0ABY7EK85_MYAAR|nr:hypothetical protein MAR_034645 [Mya arenaria]
MTKTVEDRRETQPGTPAYQAPEILLQARRGRTQADVWSLCCSLVELFTAKTIWDLTSEDDENDDSVQNALSIAIKGAPAETNSLSTNPAAVCTLAGYGLLKGDHNPPRPEES